MQSLDQQVLNRVLEALDSIYSPRTSNESRKAAQAFCEQLKDDQMAPVYGRYFADWSRPQSGIIRHFGLGLLENSLRYKWQKYSEQDRELIRDCAVELAQQYAAIPPGQSCENYLVEKLACVFSELIEREWPQRWPELNGLLEQLFQHTPRGTEFVLEVLKNVIDDTTTFINPITAARKHDLWNAMLTIMLPVPQSPDSSLVPVEFYEICRVSAGNPGWLQRSFNLLGDGINNPDMDQLSLRCVALIAACAEWIPIGVACEKKMTEILLLVMNQPKIQLRMTACNALISLVGRKYADWEQVCETLLNPLLKPDFGSQIIQQCWINAGGDLSVNPPKDIDHHLENEYPFLKQLSVLWAQLGIDHLFSKKIVECHSGIGEFIKLALMMMRSPSIAIIADQALLWHTIIRTEHLFEQPAVKFSIGPLFNNLTQYLDKQVFESSDDDDALLSQRYSYADYADSWYEELANVRGWLLSIIRLATKLQPDFCLNRLGQSMSQLAMISSGSDISATRHLWETETSLIGTVIASLPEGYLGTTIEESFSQPVAEHRRLVRQLLETLMNLPTSDTVVMGRKLDVMSNFSGFLRFESPELAFSLLQKLFELAKYRAPNETNLPVQSLCSDTISLRRKSFVSMIKMSLGIPELLSQIYDQVAAEVWRMFDNDLVTFFERSQLSEFLVCITHHASIAADEKARRYDIIFEQTASKVCSDQFRDQISSVQSFSKLIGIDELAGAAGKNASMQLSVDQLQRLENCSLNRGYLAYLISSYRACLIRTTKDLEKYPADQRLYQLKISPWACHLQAVLPNYLQILRSLHSLWDSAALPPSLAPLLQISVVERNAILGRVANHPSDVVVEDQSLPSKNSLGFWLNIYRDWLRSIRCSLYQLLGQASTIVADGVFYSPTIASSILDSVFASVSSMTNIHWGYLILFFLKDAVVHCPEAYFDSFLGSLMPDVIAFVDAKLEVEWQSVVAKGLLEINAGDQPLAYMELQSPVNPSALQSPDPSTGAALSEEMVYQQSVRDLTRKLCEIWVAIFLQSKVDPAAIESTRPSATSSGPQATSVTTAGASKMKPIPDFGVHNALAMYLLRNTNIARPLLIHLSHAMSWKDTKTARHSTQILQRILPLLMADSTAHPFVSQDLLLAALKALHDPYHKDAHDVLLSLITDIYVQLRLLGSNSVLSTFGSLIPSLADKETMDSFDQRLMSDQLNGAQQRKLMREALKDMFGVSPSQWFNTSKSSIGLAIVPAKLRLQKPQKPEQESLIDSERNEDLGLLNMFKP